MVTEMGPTRTSLSPPNTMPRSTRPEDLGVPPAVLQELRRTHPSPPDDQFAYVGKCASTGKDVTLCYSTFGRGTDPCVLLIMGMDSSALFWDSRFCTYLAAAGFFVIRYDNRDVGLSTFFDEYPRPAMLHLALPAWASIKEIPPPYTLEDMADDAAGLLRALGIAKAHVVGCSMGGMIAQRLILRHPELVASLCLHSTSCGGAWPRPSMLIHLLDRPESSSSVQSVLDFRVRFFRAVAGEIDFDEHAFRTGMWYEYARSSHHASAHFPAIARARDYTEELKTRINREPAAAAAGKPSAEGAGATSIHVPVVIVHGGKDPLIPIVNAQRMAEAIHGARLVIFPKMGHYFPPALHRAVADVIILNARSAVDPPTPAPPPSTT